MYNAEDLAGILILIFLFFIGPQVWREDNSWWFAIVKFWLYTMPKFYAVVGVLFLVGPAYAIVGIFYHGYYSIATVLYFVTISTKLVSVYLRKHKPAIFKKIQKL